MNTELSKEEKEEKEEMNAIAYHIDQYQRTCYHEAGHAVMHYLKKIPFQYVQVEYLEMERFFMQANGELFPIDADLFQMEGSLKEAHIKAYKAMQGVTMKTVETLVAKVEPMDNCREPLFIYFSMDKQLEDPENPKHRKLLTYAENELMICLAGPIAEMIFVGEEFNKETKDAWVFDLAKKYGADGDLRSAERTAHMTYFNIGENLDKWLDWLAYRVERIFKQSLYWSMVADVAFNLGDFGSLTCKEVTQICRSVEKEYKKKSLKEVKE